MHNNFKNWITNNKLTAALIVVVLYLVGKNLFPNTTVMFDGGDYSTGIGNNTLMQRKSAGAEVMEMAPSAMMTYDEGVATSSFMAPPINDAALTMQSNRRVVTNSDISVLVKDVRDAVDDTSSKAEELGGYVVSKNVRTPIEGGSGYVSLRIPLEKRIEMMAFLQQLGIRVLNENVNASDITDQYEDLNAQLATLEKTQAKFEEIYERAETIEDILSVQNQLMYIQNQIDSVTGRMKAMEIRSETTLITVQFTTDELALGFAPGDPWRPNVTFKLAVRSLSEAFRNIGNAVIWLAVYSVFWAPVLIGVLVYRSRKNPKKK